MIKYDIQNDYNFWVTDFQFVLEREPNPKWQIINLTNQNYYILGYAISGESFYNFNGRDYVLKKGDLLFFPKGMFHTGKANPDNPWSFFSVAFDLQFANESTRNKFDAFPNLINVSNFSEFFILFTKLNNSWTGKKPGFLINCRSIMMQLLYLFIREKDLLSQHIPHFHTIEKIINHIESNFTKTYSVEELARMAGLSPSHFRLLFKRVTGFSVTQYQINMKINKAKDLLISGACNVSEAAYLLGFNNIYYFSRLFKKNTGVNPSDYLKGYGS